MFYIQAPFPRLQTTILLPSPDWGDTDGLTSTFNTMRTMNNTLYTYIKSKDGRRKLKWTFTLTRHKAMELAAFFKAYYYSCIKITTHLNEGLIGYLVSNPFESIGIGPAPNFPGGEVLEIALEFEEKD